MRKAVILKANLNKVHWSNSVEHHGGINGYNDGNNSSVLGRITLNSSGALEAWTLVNEGKRWHLRMTLPADTCDSCPGTKKIGKWVTGQVVVLGEDRWNANLGQKGGLSNTVSNERACVLWFEELKDIRVYSDGNVSGRDIFVRMELDNNESA
ncbi:hypothetical protein Tco_0192901, partial [Tanacetum coccineum]